MKNMRNKVVFNWTNVLLAALFVVSLALLGCQNFMDSFTPAYLPERSAEYVGIDRNAVGLTTLKDAKEIQQEISILHRNAQLELKRLAQDDKFAYQDALRLIEYNIEQSEALQQAVVAGGGEGGLGFGLAEILLGAAPALAIGRAMKRKGDLSPEEVEAEKAKATKETA
jgi:hypothetical protein